MDIPNQASAIILVASDITTDAVLVRNLLKEEFNHVFTSTDPVLSAGDFARYQPDVLVMAFNTLENRNATIWVCIAFVRKYTSVRIAP